MDEKTLCILIDVESAGVVYLLCPNPYLSPYLYLFPYLAQHPPSPHNQEEEAYKKPNGASSPP